MTADLAAMEAAAQRLLTAHGLTVDGTGDNDRVISPAITSARDVLALAAALRTERAAREEAHAHHAALVAAVRAYLDAADASRRITGESYDALDDGAIDDWRTRHGAASKAKVAARTALDAALLAATTTPEEGHG